MNLECGYFFVSLNFIIFSSSVDNIHSLTFVYTKVAGAYVVLTIRTVTVNCLALLGIDYVSLLSIAP